MESGDLPVPPPAPEARLSTESLDFDPQAVGTESDPKTVTLSNIGDATLGIRGTEIQGNYAQSSDCSSFVDPGQACTFSVTFSPESSGAQAGSMTIDSSGAGGPLTVALSGDGFVSAGIELSPDRLDFPDTGLRSVSEPQTVTASNTGTVDLTIIGVSTTDDYSRPVGAPTP
jgi:hypothetical protein